MSTSRKIRTIAALGTLSGAVWAGTFASFTDSAATSATSTTGTVDLVANADTDDAFAVVGLTMTNAGPGDAVYGEIAVNNAGPLGFTYDLATVTTDDVSGGKPAGLGAALRLSVSLMAATGNCNSEQWGNHTAVPLDLPSLAGNSITTPRSLATTVTEHLCVRVLLPSDTGNALQGASTSASLTFTATQL